MRLASGWSITEILVIYWIPGNSILPRNRKLVWLKIRVSYNNENGLEVKFSWLKALAHIVWSLEGSSLVDEVSVYVLQQKERSRSCL